ncbi:MAG: RluA family pseudouridine synthase [Beijerinckiaceae bacterium]
MEGRDMTNGSQKRKRRAGASEATGVPATPTGVQTIAVTADEAGMRLDRWFKRRMPGLGLSHLNKIVRTGQVRIDGARVKTAARLQAGQTIRVPPLALEAPVAPAIRRAPSSEDARALRDMTLFEDRDLLVLNKPFGLAVQGGSGTLRHIDGMLDALADENGERPRLVHRLDRDTSGVLLVAKSRRMAADLGEIFRSRQARKIYWALVEGVPKPAQGRISLFLAKGEGMGDARSVRTPGAGRDIERMRIAKHGEADALHSITYYAIVDKIAPKLAWLSMKPLTGRTHQLRAHAEAIGHPIFGDPKYGHAREDQQRRRDPILAVPNDVERKLHLLARRLVLPHPRGGTLDVTAPLPPHMVRSWEKFGFDAKQYDPIEGAPEA